MVNCNFFFYFLYSLIQLSRIGVFFMLDGMGLFPKIIFLIFLLGA